MVDMISSANDFAGGILSGDNIVKVKFFGLDQNLNPIIDVREYELK